MQALYFDASVPRFVAGKVLGALYKPAYWSGLSCLRYGDVPEPVLPGPGWVKIRTRYGGICGSDLNGMRLHVSPYLSPFGSQPSVMGHENLGTIVEMGPDVPGWQLGDRVIANIVLSCRPRGLEPCPACRRGDENLCRCYTEGNLPPGTILGACAATDRRAFATLAARGSARALKAAFVPG
jgi:threonine dehydrogenase-like Zn-dependent dehydrogenase